MTLIASVYSFPALPLCGPAISTWTEYSRGMPVYDIDKSSQNNKMTPNQKYCASVELHYKGKVLYIHQASAV